MSAIAWLIYSNVMVLLFLVTYVMSSLNLTQTQLANKVMDIEQRVNGQVVTNATVIQNHASQIDTALNRVSVITQSSPGDIGTNGDIGTSGFGGGVFTGGQPAELVTLQNVANDAANYANSCGARLNQLYALLRTAKVLV